MAYPRKEIEIVVRLPKEFRIDSLGTSSIPLDENFMVTIREGHRNIGEMKLKDARRKYG
jgi:hypothetical protein